MIFPPPSVALLRFVARVLAWFLLAVVIVVTLGPADIRPSTGLPLKVERFLGFAILAAAFTAAYPKRWRIIIALLAGAAVSLEALQLVIPTRDASPIDAAVKVLGATGGGTFVHLLIAVFTAQRQRANRPLVVLPSGTPPAPARSKETIR